MYIYDYLEEKYTHFALKASTNFVLGVSAQFWSKEAQNKNRRYSQRCAHFGLRVSASLCVEVSGQFGTKKS